MSELVYYLYSYLSLNYVAERKSSVFLLTILKARLSEDYIRASFFLLFLSSYTEDISDWVRWGHTKAESFRRTVYGEHCIRETLCKDRGKETGSREGRKLQFNSSHGFSMSHREAQNQMARESHHQWIMSWALGESLTVCDLGQLPFPFH